MASAQQNTLRDKALHTLTSPKSLEELNDFSLVLGGPVFQLFRRSHLTGDGLELLRRRLLTITLIVWLPLLLLAIVFPPAGHPGRLSFFYDLEVHIRFLIALPILVGAELIVHSRIRPVVSRFVERGIVLPVDLPRFHRAVDSAVRLRNSIPIELGLFLVVYAVSLGLWNERPWMVNTTWYAMPGSPWHLTPAGFWYVFVSIPFLRFTLFRWYLRLFIWFRFLWHVSRINLNLIPTHPDRAAGLAFLGKSAYAFGPILFAQGVMLAGVVAERVIYRGQSLISFKLQIAGFVIFFVLAILGPLLMFNPQMAQAKRQGLADYGQLAQRYVENFEQKWVVRDPSASEELLGTSDIQSLADLGNSYAMVRDMRPIPFWLEDVARLAAVTAAPLLPLLLTIFSPDELIMRVMKIVF
jgi:hypothetical protein